MLSVDTVALREELARKGRSQLGNILVKRDVLGTLLDVLDRLRRVEPLAVAVVEAYGPQEHIGAGEATALRDEAMAALAAEIQEKGDATARCQ